LKKFDEEDFDIPGDDFRMDGMNGVELAKKVHEKNLTFPSSSLPAMDRLRRQRCLRMPAKEDLFPALLEKIKMFLVKDNRAAGSERPRRS